MEGHESFQGALFLLDRVSKIAGVGLDGGGATGDGHNFDTI